MKRHIPVDRLIGLAAVLLALAVALVSSAIEYSFSSDPLGPRAFPYAVAVVCALCGAWLVARPAGQEFALSPTAWRALAFVVLCLASALLYPVAGFMIATFVLCAGASWMFGATRLNGALVGLGNAVLLWLLFAKVFEIPLPPNPILGF